MSDSSSGSCAGSLFLIIVILVATLWFNHYVQFSYSEVKPKLERVLGTDDFRVIEQTNNSIWTGNPGDVVYNLELKETGEVVSCRCTKDIFQPLICRKYQ